LGNAAGIALRRRRYSANRAISVGLSVLPFLLKRINFEGSASNDRMAGCDGKRLDVKMRLLGRRGSAPENIERSVCVEARPSARAYFSVHFIDVFGVDQRVAARVIPERPRIRMYGVSRGSCARRRSYRLAHPTNGGRMGFRSVVVRRRQFSTAAAVLAAYGSRSSSFSSAVRSLLFVLFFMSLASFQRWPDNGMVQIALRFPNQPEFDIPSARRVTNRFFPLGRRQGLSVNADLSIA
jgi:hypothetical protein